MKIFKKRDSGFAGSIMGIDGDYAEAIFRLDNDEVVVIGRDPKTSHIVMGENCSRISRTHCSICVNSANGTYTVRDLSSNGTFINGSRIARGVDVQAPRGSILAVGDMHNTFRLN
ncbi:MAG: FHA domain-containing protein [Clostridia bacterium]|nr:FHA domain-containing protein [Clostridia bacterium]